MSAALDWSLWRPLFATLTAGTVMILTAALLLQLRTRSMAWRRTIWQVAFLSLGLLAIMQISGATQAVLDWLPRPAHRESDGQLVAESRIIGEPELRMLLAQRAQPSITPSAPPIPNRPSTPESVRWPGAVWVLGSGLVLGWMVIARLIFLVFVPRRTLRDERLLARVDSLARRLGMAGRVRVGETRGLAGPIAFGILRPGISLPEGFSGRFTSAQQDAMLAHELAHLAARDPFWHALADVVVAVLWWHPLAWLAQRQLRAASEAAADEASLVVENGPGVLAECLVQLGARLTRAHSLGWLGMAGADFRSGLGRRVKRLLSLNDQSWKPAPRSRAWLFRVILPLALIALTLAATLWAQPRPTGPATLRQAFQRSVLGLALAAAMPQAPVEPGQIDWQSWSPEAVAAARADGKLVLVHFTADWAVTAKANEQTSLEAPAVRAKLQELGAIALRGDFTTNDEGIAEELRSFGRTGVPLTLVYSSDPSLPPQVLPELLTPQIVLDALEQSNAEPPKQPSAKAVDAAASERNKAPALILQGKALREAGQPAEARARFEAALKLDPGNAAAKYYLSLPVQAPAAAEGDIDDMIKERIREQFGDRVTFTEHLQAEGITYETYRRRERDRIIKLDSIRLEEVSFPGLPLSEVVQKLDTIIKASDPDGKGINFIVATNDVIHLNRPLRDVTLRQALDAIVLCAEIPLAYTVQDNAVVFSPRPPRPPLHTRWFRVDANIFGRALFQALATNPDQAMRKTNAPASVAPQSSDLLSDARRYFTRAGVDFTMPGKQLFFEDRSGALMVRATLEDLDIIEQVIQVLNTPPPQVTIEAKFIEITASDAKALGFDWFLGHTPTQNSDLGPQMRLASEVNPAASVGVPLDPNSAASTENLLNLFQEFRTHPLPALPSSTGAMAPRNEPVTGILTDPQYRVVIRALEQRPGVNILTTPKVTTLSGRQAQMKTVKVSYIVTDLDLSQVVSNATTKSSEVKAQPIAEPFELGPVLDVVPSVQADGYTIQMTLIPTFIEFLGYDVENARRFPTEVAADRQQLTPLPIFRKRQIVSSVAVYDGQTVVLAGGSDQLLANPNKNEPLRAGTKPRDEPKNTTLLIFVTPTLIDPAGNRIHP